MSSFSRNSTMTYKSDPKETKPKSSKAILLYINWMAMTILKLVINSMTMDEINLPCTLFHQHVLIITIYREMWLKMCPSHANIRKKKTLPKMWLAWSGNNSSSGSLSNDLRCSAICFNSFTKSLSADTDSATWFKSLLINLITNCSDTRKWSKMSILLSAETYALSAAVFLIAKLATLRKNKNNEVRYLKWI